MSYLLTAIAAGALTKYLTQPETDRDAYCFGLFILIFVATTAAVFTKAIGM